MRLFIRAVLASGVALTACNHGCIDGPGCPANVPATISIVSAATNAPVTGATVHVSRETLGDVPCDQHCILPVDAGDYDIIISAPGFQSTERTFTAKSQTEKIEEVGAPVDEHAACTCVWVEGPALTISLMPN